MRLRCHRFARDAGILDISPNVERIGMGGDEGAMPVAPIVGKFLRTHVLPAPDDRDKFDQLEISLPDARQCGSSDRFRP